MKKSLEKAKLEYISKFKHVSLKDGNNECVPKYKNFTANNPDAKALEVIKDPNLVNYVFNVYDFNNNEVRMSAEWLSGFVDGEGTFTFFINKNKDSTMGYQIQAAFIIVQGEADYALLTAIADFLGKGTVNVNRKDKTSVRYQIRIVDLNVLINIIIPLFTIAELRTKKKDEFTVWTKWALYLKDKDVATEPESMIELLEGIKELKFVGSLNDKSLSFLITCDEAIAFIKQKFNIV